MKGRYAAQHKKEAEALAAKRNHLAANDKFKAGDIIQFWGGYNNDIRYQTQIVSIDNNGELYLVWDCYWFPIRDEDCRNIKIIN
jgi:hypothetical protein